MYLSVIVNTLGGLAIFVLGMKFMTEGLQMSAGNRIRNILRAVSSNRILGCLTGTVVTAIIQSSSATTVMVIGFVTAGLMTLEQAVGVIIGANIGTTMTAQLIAFKFEALALPAIAIGVPMKFFATRKKYRYAGEIIAGFGLLFFGLSLMGDGLKPLRTDPAVVEFFTKFDPAHTGGLMLCVLIGAVVTMIVQSSSATVGLTMTLATQGLISLPAAIALVLGENIGTTITAQLATIGSGNVNSYRAANAHTLFNVLGVILVTAIFPWFLQAVDWVTITLMHAPANTMVDGAYPHAGRFVANAHTLFNVLNAVIFLTFFPILIKVTLALSPKDKEAGDPLFRMPQFDQRTLDNPVAAMAQVRGEISHMAEVVRAAYCNAIESIMQHDHKNIRKWQRFERHIDEMHKTLMLVLTQIMQSEINEEASQEISEQIRIINNLERIGDAVEIIAMLGEDIMDKDIPMSPQSWEDLQTMREKVGQFLDLIRQGLRTPPANFLEEAEILEASIDALRENIRCAYIERLKNAQCSVEGGTIFMNMITRMEKIGDCCFTIARAVTRQV
ncbi:MAG: Na/Pi cotransporter family protein [Desulfomicrobiaceae bacterium]